MYNIWCEGDKMIYLRERTFIEKLFAALQLSGCDKLDISEENISNIIPIIYKMLEERKVLNNLDELKLLFEETFDHKYIDIYKVINSLDPLFAEREDDTLFIIGDKNLSKEMVKSDLMFKEEDIVYISNGIKPLIRKKDKVKELKFHAFN